MTSQLSAALERAQRELREQQELNGSVVLENIGNIERTVEDVLTTEQVGPSLDYIEPLLQQMNNPAASYGVSGCKEFF